MDNDRKKVLTKRDSNWKVHTCRGLEERNGPREKVSPMSPSTGEIVSDHAKGDHNSTHVCWPCTADWTSVNSYV